MLILFQLDFSTERCVGTHRLLQISSELYGIWFRSINYIEHVPYCRTSLGVLFACSDIGNVTHSDLYSRL